jgi:membrane protease subunit (stomatin/prohibitin family)
MVSLFGKKPAGDGSIPATGGSVLGSTTIAWGDQDKQDNVMWKVPRNIRLNDNIVVREDEIAVFYRDGKVLTYFDQPNRYALTDFNAPVVGNLLKFFTGVVQEAEVYYLQKRYMDGKFGSSQPYQFTDPTFGIVSLRVFGEYRWRVSSPENFINQFVGTFSAETSADVEDRLKEQMVILLYNALGKMKAQGLKVTDLAGNLTNIEQMVLATTPDNFGQYGVEINKISEAASNPSGVAGVGAGLGVGLGAGVGVGGAFGSAMMGGMGGMGQGATRSCSNCGSIIPLNTAFCPNCGAAQTGPQQAQQQAQQQASATTPKFCPNCGTAITGSPKFCPNCGTKV